MKKKPETVILYETIAKQFARSTIDKSFKEATGHPPNKARGGYVTLFKGRNSRTVILEPYLSRGKIVWGIK